MDSFHSFLLLLVVHLTTEWTMVSGEPKGNIYTAIAHMEPLVDIEERLIKISREYVQQERKKLDGLKQFAQNVREAMELSKDEPLKYLGNPVNSYLIIKRFTSGWKELGNRLEIDDTKMEEIKTILKSNEDHLPTRNKDLLGATNSIFRLQDTYNITAREISDGVIKGVSKSVHQFTAQDCLDIADYAHTTRRYVRMKEWAEEAERLMENHRLSDRHGNITKSALYEILGWAEYMSNNMEGALKYTRLILKDELSYRLPKWHGIWQQIMEDFVSENQQIKDPLNEKALKNKEIYDWYIYHKEPSTEPETSWMKAAQHVLNRFIEMDYIQACRNKYPILLKVKDPSKLVCYYKGDAPSFILKPIKTTRMHDNPEVLIHHDVITDSEISILTKLAIPYLKQAKVVNPDNTDEIIEADYRIAKTMWLENISPRVQKISRKLDRRFEELTGLSMETAEQLQLNNYGLGGQYEFHIDHGEDDSMLALHPNGNRLATILCYLSDVERGGETVFTKLGLSIPPRKGDVVFWYNLHLNGRGISDTEHASCPVVSGSKWVANKWIHQHGNEFRRKCSWDEDA